MSLRVAHLGGIEHDMSGHERFNPMDYPLALELRPKRLTSASAWVMHIPLAYALVQMCRPGALVELGTHKGDSYCAFCQAVAALGLAGSSRCYAIDTWAGDPHAGAYGEDVLADLRGAHDPSYGAFSTLVQSTFDDALPRFSDGSIDLLHIDGFHTYEAVKHDFETWRPKLSPRAVVLFHDTQERGRDFGVWKFWEEVTTSRPHFEFLFGHGLGVLAVGEDVPAPLLRFLEIARREPQSVNLYFSQLGTGIERLRVVRAVLKSVHAMRCAVDERRRECGNAPVASPTLAEVFDDPVATIERLSDDVLAMLPKDSGAERSV
jgi:hypothetical protein